MLGTAALSLSLSHEREPPRPFLSFLRGKQLAVREPPEGLIHAQPVKLVTAA